jgi:hypothetical protein
MRRGSTALAALAVMAVAAAPAAAKPKLSVKTAQAKVVKRMQSGWGKGGTYKATCRRESGRLVTCVLVRTSGTGAECGRGDAKLGRRGAITARAWALTDCSGIPGAPAVAPAPAAAPPAAPAPGDAPPPPAAPAPPPAPAPPAALPNPNGYAKGQTCTTDSENDYRAAGFTCQASGLESCIYTDFGRTCLPISMLFPLNPDGTVGSRSVTAFSAAAKRRKAPKAPSASVVKKLLYDHYGEGGKEDSMGATHTFDWTSVKVLEGHRAKVGEMFKPGTWVWPARAKWTSTTVMSGGTTMVRRWDAKISVYRDDYGDWTFANNGGAPKIETIRCAHADGREFEC